MFVTVVMDTLPITVLLSLLFNVRYDTDTNTFKTKFDILYPYDFYNIIYDNDNDNDNDRSDIIDRLSTVMNSYSVPYNGSTTNRTTSTFILMLQYFYQKKSWSEIGLTIHGYNVNQSAGPNRDGYYTGDRSHL